MLNLTGMIVLNYLDMSNNTFDTSDVPSGVSTLQSLTTLIIDRTSLQCEVPVKLFGLPNLQTVALKNNQLNGTLDIGASYSNQLKIINLQSNFIVAFADRGYNVDPVTIILVNNLVYEESGQAKSYCMVSQPNNSYQTPKNCVPSSCSSDQILSPNCNCAYPYKRSLFFRAPSFSDLGNSTYYVTLQNSLMTSF